MELLLRHECDLQAAVVAAAAAAAAVGPRRALLLCRDAPEDHHAAVTCANALGRKEAGAGSLREIDWRQK